MSLLSHVYNIYFEKSKFKSPDPHLGSKSFMLLLCRLKVYFEGWGMYVYLSQHFPQTEVANRVSRLLKTSLK